MSLSTVAVVPALNAERSVGDVTEALLRRFGPGKVIVVDDGSTDGTAATARDAGAAVLRHPTNRGKGAALRTAFVQALARGATHAVTVDADGQHLPEEAQRLAVHGAPADNLVLGVRNLSRDGAPRANRISNEISNFFLSRFCERPLRDTQCGLRRYPLRRTLDLRARDDGYAFEAEVVLRAARAGWGITEVDVAVFYPDESERITHFDSVRDPARIVWRVVATLGERRGTR